MFRMRSHQESRGQRSKTSQRRDRFRRLTEETLEPRLLLAANGSEMRTYRLAVSATEEYTAFFGDDRMAAQAEIVSVVDAVNVVLNAELNVHLDLIDNLDIIFGPGNSPDPFSAAGADPSPALDENQALLDSVLGFDGYDIGHVFGTFTGGRATLGGAGVDSPFRIKGKGASGIPVSGNNGPDSGRLVDIVLHELGHHFAANHSFNGELGACAERNAPTAYEPGSGTTIMSYAGVCPAVFADPPAGDNLQNTADTYFHAGNLAEIIPHLEMLDAAGVGTLTGANVIPIVDAGADFTIPAATPFEITVSGSDVDDPSGDSLRYTIEQLDVGDSQSLDSFPGDNGASPLFRSFPPAPAQDGGFTRTFPQLSDILTGATTKGEYLPSTTRDLNFRATVRDGVGGTSDDDLTISVVDTGAPFLVTSPNTATTIVGGSTQTVTWDVAGTSGGLISTSMVDIRLSTDGGTTFPFSLAVTENDGSHDLVFPNLDTSSARIKIAGAGNIFFDVSDADFTIDADSSASGVTVSDGVMVGERGLFAPDTDTYAIALNTDPGGTVELSVSADGQSEVSVDGSPFAASVTFLSSSTTAKMVTVRAKDDSVGEGPHTSTITHAIVSGTVDYPAGTLINDLVADVVDDEQPPLVGVDMYFPGGSIGTVPMNWNEFDTTAPQLLDLIRDDGVATAIDLEIILTNITSIGGASVSAMADTLPIHSPSLEGLDDNLRWRNSSTNPMPFANVEAIWSDLIPGARYAIYVFAMESSSTDTINQLVTITGSGVDDPTPFMQATAGKDDILIVNDEDGDASRTLESYAKIVTADAAGSINVNVRRDDGVIRNRVYLAGLAIQEVHVAPPPLPTVNFTTSSQSGPEDVGTMTVTASLSAATSSEVTVPFTLSGDATEGIADDYTITASPITIPAGMTSAEITITVNNDALAEPSESVIVTMGTPTGAILGTTTEHIATITDNDTNNDLDFGDAPTAIQSGFASDYPTTLPDGARHTTSALVLGATVDSEVNGQPTVDADGDGADEDGVRFVTSVVTTSTAATTASVLVTASAPGKLDAWIDFTRDGDWLDVGERLFATSVDLVAGPNIISYPVPAGASAGDTYARFRFSSAGGLDPTGPAVDGEVEDYRLAILDGSSPVPSEIDMVVGDVEVIADSSDVVFRQDGVELFRAPGSALASTELLGTDGDDALRLGNLTSALTTPIPLIYDGGAGRDSMTLIDSDQTLDLTNATLNQLANIEEIDIAGASSNALTLDGPSVTASTDDSNTLLVVHDDDDTVDYSGAGWNVIPPIFVAGGQRHVLTNGGVRIETINTLPFQNPLARTDVNFMGGTTTLDALNVINFLGRLGMNPVDLPTPTSAAELPERYYDVNGSRSASSLDALNVINFLATLGEDELTGAEFVSPKIPLPTGSGETTKLSNSDRTAMERSEIDKSVRDTLLKDFGSKRATALVAAAGISLVQQRRTNEKHN